jgi:2-dehydro-3-deoxy-D-arabinonate dehydratase
MKVYRSEKGLGLEIDGKFYGVREDLPEQLFRSGRGEAASLLSQIKPGDPVNEITETLPPALPGTEIWASGVTYQRSKTARMEESEKAGGDVFYDLVYEAERPELFFKSMGWRAVGSGGPIRVRADSEWDVPEPELTLAVNAGGEIFGFTVGNDVSSRSIEGENPLYLPQAKVYRGSCALGPGLLLGSESLDAEASISLTITREDRRMFEGQTDLTQLKRSFEELVEFLYRELDFPEGAMLMTGTGVVPGSDFTLKSGDVVEIGIAGIGTLQNVVA